MTVERQTQVPDRRQRRWRDLHDRLYRAACELFLESDFITTSVDEIAERADVARKTAFNHFPRKRDFIAEWGRRRRDFVQSQLSPQVLESSPIDEVFRHYFGELAALNVDQRPLTMRMLAGWRESGGPFDGDPHLLITVFRNLLTTAAERGELRDDADPARVATMLYSCYFGILYDWAEGADGRAPFDLDVAYSQMLDVVLEGLLARTGPSAG